uniref:Uncharacterized protein n=1 Tax=Arundo donax TaxID=35708 RepID=A0A0A9HJ69_ARUDO
MKRLMLIFRHRPPLSIRLLHVSAFETLECCCF